MVRVIAPQATRIALLPTVGFMVQVIKNTSIASLVVGYGELTYTAKLINNATFQPFVSFGIAGLLYFLACRSEENTSELQSLMRTSYPVFCLIKKHITVSVNSASIPL